MIEINFVDQLGRQGYISINSQDINTSLALDASAHPILSFNNANIFEPIRTSSLELTLLVPRSFPFNLLKPNLTAQYRIGSDRSLQWQGTLDTSQLRFPFFVQGDLIPLTLTFVDFAPLADRFFAPNTLTPDVISALDALIIALYGQKTPEASGFRRHLEAFPAPIDIKNQNIQNCAQCLDSIFVATRNFFDENNTPLNCFQVVTSILQPLGLHIRQVGYAFPIIYSITDIAPAYHINADHADSLSNFTLDAPVSYAEVTHSTFADNAIFDYQMAPDDINPNSKYHLFALDTNTLGLNYVPGFRLHIGKPITYDIPNLPQFQGLNANLRFAHIDPITSGQDKTIILALAKGSGNNHSTVPEAERDINYNIIPDPFNLSCPRLNPIAGGGFSLFQPAFLIDCGLIQSDKYAKNQRIHISLPLLADARYNPFEEPSEYNFESAHQKLNTNANFAYIPVQITITDPTSNKITHYYTNHNTVLSNSWHDANFATGQWRSVSEAPMPETVTAWLAYYDADDRTKKTGLGCFNTNHQTIGCTTENLPRQIKAWGDNLVIPLPPASGILHFTVGLGIFYHDHRTRRTDLHPLFRFFAYQLPKITIAESYNTAPIFADNVAVVSHPQFKPQNLSTARDTLDLTTILATLDPDETSGKKTIPASARGYLLNAKGEPLPSDFFTAAPNGTTQFMADLVARYCITPHPYNQKVIEYSTLDNYPTAADSSVSVIAITDADQTFAVLTSSEDLITRSTQYNARQII